MEGAIAEIAVARYLGTEFPASIDNYKEPDLDTFIEVRCAVVQPPNDITEPHLFFRKGDLIERAYVLVVGCAPVYYIVGWIWGRSALMAASPDKDGTRWIRQDRLSDEQELKNHLEYVKSFRGITNRGMPYALR